MELTQKLECTQEICANNYEKEFPEQVILQFMFTNNYFYLVIKNFISFKNVYH